MTTVWIGDPKTGKPVPFTSDGSEVDGYGIPVNLTAGVKFDSESANIDAFGRLRVSNVDTLFDSKQIHDNQPLFWDDQEVSGGGTGSTWSQATASTVMSVSATTAGKRVRQTFMRFNYQPGKSQLILMTGTLGTSGGGTGITRAMGAFDDNNGIFARDNEGVVELVIRSSTSGGPQDNAVTQTNWNHDKLDGTGPSGYTLNPSASQILFIDYEWLGIGRVRMGFVIHGKFNVCHEFLHANLQQGVYMSTPNLPLRYEIENDGTGAASSLEHICSTVMSEGGVHDLGVNHALSTEATFVNANTAGTSYALFGIRLKAANLDSVVKIAGLTVLCATNDNYHWELVLNPTVAGSPSWSDYTNSTVQTATGDVAGNPSATTVTNGTVLAHGFVKSGAAAGANDAEIDTQLRLGSAIDGTPDEIWLTVIPLAANADVYGGLLWREIG